MTKRMWRLVESELGMVEAVAFRVARRLPISVEREDLASIGRLALIAAAETFDRKRGVTFGAYARFRVRGAMLDSMRSKANYAFELHDEVEEDCRDTESDDVANAHIVPMDARANAEEQTRSREVVGLIRRALDSLDAAERYAILARADGRTLKEIGARFGRSEAWGHALVRGAREKMRRSLAMYRLDGRAA
jgi:RNA polymerase sigma factor (sigma-70 family)